MSFLRTWDWPNLLSEFQRVTKPGGVIRITECSILESNSPALNSLNVLFLSALSQAGHFFMPNDKNGVINGLASLLERHGLNEVQTRLYTLEYRAGTAEGENFYENEMHIFRLLLPFFRKWCRVPDDYEAIYRKMLKEIKQPDFVGTMRLLTAWGINAAEK